MSNLIWKTPDIKPEENKLIFAQHQCRRDGNIDYFIWDIHEFIDAIRKDSIRWCYLDDLIAQADKAERLQKQLDGAIWWCRKPQIHTDTTDEMALKELDNDK